MSESVSIHTLTQRVTEERPTHDMELNDVSIHTLTQRVTSLLGIDKHMVMVSIHTLTQRVTLVVKKH